MKLYIFLSFLIMQSQINNAKVLINQPTPEEQKKHAAQQYLYNIITNEHSNQSSINSAIQQGADINAPINGQYPLVLAVLMNHSKVVTGLINNGANVQMNYQHYPLAFYAIKKSYFEVADALIAKGAPFAGSINGRDVFTHIAMIANTFTNQQYQEVNAALKLLATISKTGYDTAQSLRAKDLAHNPWYIALKDNNQKMISFFLNQIPYDYHKLANHADPNSVFTFSDGSSLTPLLIAIDNYVNISKTQSNLPDTKAFEDLIKAGAQLDQKAKPFDKKEHTALSYALINNADGMLIDFLLKNKASWQEAITLLLQNGFSPNYAIPYKSYNFKIPLLLKAIAQKNYLSVKKLVEAGADIDSPHEVRLDLQFGDKKLFTPLQAAIKIGDADIINYLIQKGAE